ncbi:hypothetical protein [Aquihabitans sp. McL0605]
MDPVVVTAVLAALAPAGVSIRDHADLVPNKPGLYALRGSPDSWD